jgi:PAS domain S-box-containing protein
MEDILVKEDLSNDDILVREDLSNIDFLFKQLCGISVDGMRVIDDEGKILMVNDSFCKIFRMNKDQLLGYPFSVVYASGEQEAVLKTYRDDILNNKLKTFFERENTLQDGKKAWFEFSNSILTLPDGKKITLSIIKDITERKRSEIELLESELKYRTLFNNTNDAIFVTILSDEKSYGDFIEVNDAACLKLGYTKEEFLKLSPSAIISPRNINDFNLNMQQVMKARHVIFDSVHRAKDKKLIPVEISSHLFFYNNKPTVLSVARDITERKRAEEKLKRTSKLLRELATHLQSIREEERSMIAHEIHDELGQVLTALKIQLLLFARKLNKDQKVLKEKIFSLSDMVDSSVESVQKISSKLHPAILDELGLTAAIEWQTEEFEKLTGIKCTLVLPDEEIKLDKNKSTAVFRILQEALTNIARHSGAASASISLLKYNLDICLEIKDTGKGITQEQIKDYKSLGIHGIEERVLVFGGSVYIEGIPGKGTTVKIEIPK